MTRQEIHAVLIISLIIALRLLGIFLILPIFSVYAMRYGGATLPLVGLSFGVYALVQSILQLPMGWASDRFGRKPILLAGLAMFTVGSLACGFAGNIVQLILARALQGSGAIGSVGMASLGDLTRPQVRTQAFTITGIAVGSTFVLGLLGGPLLAAHVGLGGVFYVLGVIGCLAFLITALLFPGIPVESHGGKPVSLKGIIGRVEVRQLCIAAFILSFILNLFLFRYPLDWAALGVGQSRLWKIYLLVFLPTLFLVFPYIRYAESRGDLRTPTQMGWALMTGCFIYYLAGGLGRTVLYVTGIAFFLGYTLFQPVLPSFLTQMVSEEQRGTAIGIYNLASFLGASVGGILAGTLSHFTRILPSVAGLALLLAWLLVGFPKQPESTPH